MTTIAARHAAAPGPEATDDRPWRWVAGWAAVVAVGLAWGTGWIADAHQGLRAAPLVGRWVWQADARLLGAVAFAAAGVAAGPRLARTASWRWLVLGTAGAASVWAGLLAAGDGWATPFEGRSEYLPLAVTIDSPAEFLRTFVERAPSYPVHVKGHPPGATLAFWLLDRVGLAGAGWAAVLVVIAWGAAAAAVVVAFAALAGRDAARAAAPFLALAPAAVWAAFSADALFAGVVAVAVAAVVVATGRRGRRGTALAAAGGAAIAVSLHLTYGAVPMLLVAASVLLHRRRVDLLLPCAAGAAAVTALFVAAGFWWLDGLAVTHGQYWAGVASRRPWAYYVLAGNPAALALAVGPALAVGLSRLRHARLPTRLLPAAALAAVAIANLSGLSKGEVERIWLPFVPWILTATALIPGSRQRPWLALHASAGILLQAALRSPW